MTILVDHIHSLLPPDMQDKLQNAAKDLYDIDRQIPDDDDDDIPYDYGFEYLSADDAIKIADLLKTNPCEMLQERTQEFDDFLRQSGGFIIPGCA